MNIYKLSRNFFDWSFENPEKIRPIHVSIFFFAIEHCNRLGWKEKFGFPSQMVMDAIGIKKWQTYKDAYTELLEWGFLIEIEKSKNQYSSCIISINNACDKKGKALDKALVKHGQKHRGKQGESTGDIDIQVYNNTNLQESDLKKSPTQKKYILEEIIKEQIDINFFIKEYKSTKNNILQQLKNFYLYRSEKKPGGKKEKWEMENTFDVSRRFHKWLSNGNKFGENISEKPNYSC